MNILKNKTKDLTTGNLFLKLPLFALPIALTTALQLLYSTIDLVTVANFGGGSLSMEAIGSNSALINLIITLFVSLGVGANVIMANAKGAKDQDKANLTLHNSFLLAIICGVIVAFIGFFMSEILLRWMKTPATFLDKASQYLKVYFIGLPGLMVYNFLSQDMRALGDSKRPLYILLISGVINVIGDLLFVIVLHMDVMGVAIATSLSEYLAAALCVLFFCKKNGYVRFSFKSLRFDKDTLWNILKIGLPAGVQGLGFCIPNVLIQSSLYSINNHYINNVLISVEEITAGSSASNTIENYVYAFIDAVALSCVSMVSQNYGAKKKENIKKIFWYSVSWMVIFWGVLTAICLPLSNPLMKLFITESKGININNAVAAGKERLFLMLLTYVFDGLMDVDGNYLRGMKESTLPAAITLVGCTGLRILFLLTIFKMEYFHTIFWLYAAFPISWILVCLAYIPAIIIVEKKTFVRLSYVDESKNAPAPTKA